MKQNKTELIHVRVTKDMKERIVRSSPSISDFIIDAIQLKLAKMEA